MPASDRDGSAAAHAAVDRGVRAVTHLYNAMSGLDHRAPGLAAVALTRSEVVATLIADGHHVAPEMVRLAFAAAPGRVALVTDAVAAAGMPDGPYRLGELDVVLVDGVARVATVDGSPGSLAGGTRPLLEVVRRTVAAGVALVDAVRCASVVPARVLGLPRVGALEVGRRADVLVVDEGMQPVRVLRGGRTVVGRPAP